ncbi:MAG: FkbM family methyltransferase [Candidatus Eisenbacteria bacterium]
MSLVREILRRPEFAADPPVLVDVGASGEIHHDWAILAPHAVCIAFEPDTRELGYVERSGSGYRKLVIYRAILSDRETESAEFFLTRSPYCSSTLRPRREQLTPWAFQALFDVTETTRLPTVTLARVLAEQGIERVDWFKTDSQGTDLRLFRSLGEELLRHVLAAQFEPGILDAYEGEDTLGEVLAFMRGHDFWLSELHLRGTQRLSARARQALPSTARAHAGRLIKSSPGWAEATYLNTLEGSWSIRDRLLAWVIATSRRQHGFALELAMQGMDATADPMFERMRRESAGAVSLARISFPAVALIKRLRSFAERRSWI